MTREIVAPPRSGLAALAILIPILFLAVAGLVRAALNGARLPALLCGLAIAGAVALLCGLFMVQPNQARVLQLFGRYVGSVKDAGLRWANPFYTKKSISLRVRNFESSHLKVNDLDGNPIE